MSKGFQGELNLMGQINRPMQTVEQSAIALCDTWQAAARLCVRRSGLSQEAVAGHMSMTLGALNTILNGDHNERVRHLNPQAVCDLQQICRNTAITQWQTAYTFGDLICQRTKEQRRAELLQELQSLESA